MIYICGNGGLAAEAEHFAAELTGTYGFKVYIPCVALTANTAQLTALSNDIGYENVFAHLVNVQGKRGDTFIGMTTSHAPNILKAAKVARKKGMFVILLTADNLEGDTVEAKQEYAIRELHKLAYNLKKGIYEQIEKCE